MRHLSAWAAAFLFFAGFFLAFFDFWGVTPGSRISRKFTREGAAVPTKPRPGIRSPPGARAGARGRPGHGAGGALFLRAGGAAAGLRRARRARGGGGFPLGEGGRGRAAARRKTGRCLCGRRGACGGRAGRAVARRRGRRGGAGAHGAKTAGRAGRGGVFFGAPFFLGRRAKKPRFRLIKKRGFFARFFVGSELIFPENLVLFIGLLFRPGGVMNVSRPEKRQKPKAAAGGKKRRAKREGTP